MAIVSKIGNTIFHFAKGAAAGGAMGVALLLLHDNNERRPSKESDILIGGIALGLLLAGMDRCVGRTEVLGSVATATCCWYFPPAQLQELVPNSAQKDLSTILVGVVAGGIFGRLIRPFFSQLP